MLFVENNWKIFSFRITEIDPECFQELSTLEWLKINNNDLRSLPYQLMEPVLTSLKYIDVYSKFKQRYNIIFYALGFNIYASSSNMRGNCLQRFYYQKIKKLLSIHYNLWKFVKKSINQFLGLFLKKISFNFCTMPSKLLCLENPLVCDCEMRWYRKWYLNVNDTDHMKDITCRAEDGSDVLMREVSLEDMYCPLVSPEPDYDDEDDDDQSTSASSQQLCLTGLGLISGLVMSRLVNRWL